MSDCPAYLPRPADTPCVQQPAWTLCHELRVAASVRLFCFPYAGVGASAYRAWYGSLPHSVEVHAVQLPGREARLREPCFTTIAEAVRGVVEGLGPLLDVPRVALFGHSMGAILAFETARALARQGRSPVHLFVSGRRAAHLPHRQPPIAHLARPAFLTEITRRYDGIPRQILDEPELLDLLLPALRADISMLEDYRHAEGSPLPCPITGYAGTDDAEVAVEELDAWGRHTSQAFERRVFPGGHFFIQSSRDELLDDLARRLHPLSHVG